MGIVGQFALGEGEVEFVGEAARVSGLDEVEALLFGVHVGLGNAQAKLQGADIHVLAGDVGDEGDQHIVAGLGGGLGVVFGGFDGAAQAAEKVERPGGVNAGDFGDFFQAGRIAAGVERGGDAALGGIGAGAAGDGAAEFQGRERPAGNGRFLGAGFLKAHQGDLQIGVGDDGPVDQGVERRVIKRFPPLRQIHWRCGTGGG